ncbi:MAG: transposase family protein [candidate division WOR-3 bacterium]
MLTYRKLLQEPQVAKSLICMSLDKFELAHTDHLEAVTTTRKNQKRRRVVSTGRKHKCDLRDRLLMTLFWLKAYTTYEVLGFIYDLIKTNIEDNLKQVLETLECLTHFNFDRPPAERRKLRYMRLIIDAKEQRIERPKNRKDQDGNVQDRQKPYYSGKKKTDTLKNQVAVSPTWLIEHVSESVPGSALHDMRLLRQTDSLSGLGEGEAAMLDKGYDGIRTDYPDKRLYLPFKARRIHPLSEEQRAYNHFLAKYRMVVEHTLTQLNKFQILAQRFRHQLAKHSVIFRIVAGLVNQRIQLRPFKQYQPA